METDSAPNLPPSLAPSGIVISESPQAYAFDPGCRLWITFAPSDSQWTKRLDWYLNFALAKWEFHHPRRQAPELKNVLIEEELDFPESTLRPHDPVMISSVRVLPNQEVVVITEKNDPLQLIPALIRNINAQGVRLFLSDTMDPRSARVRLEKLDWKDTNVEISLIPNLASPRLS